MRYTSLDLHLHYTTGPGFRLLKETDRTTTEFSFRWWTVGLTKLPAVTVPPSQQLPSSREEVAQDTTCLLHL